MESVFVSALSLLFVIALFAVPFGGGFLGGVLFGRKGCLLWFVLLALLFGFSVLMANRAGGDEEFIEGGLGFSVHPSFFLVVLHFFLGIPLWWLGVSLGTKWRRRRSQ